MRATTARPRRARSRETALIRAVRQLEARSRDQADAVAVLVNMALKELDAHEQRLAVLPFDRLRRRR